MNERRLFYKTLREAGRELSLMPEGTTPEKLAKALHMDDRRHREALMGWAILQERARGDVDCNRMAEDAA